MQTRLVNGLGSLLAVMAMITFVALASASRSAAQASNSNAAQGIEISPALVELNGAAGGTYIVKLKVTNVTATELYYTTSLDDFTAKDESGSPQILLDSTLPESASIKSWVTTTSSFTLGSRESREVTARVTIPADAEPGGHYGVLRFAGQAPDVVDTGVGLSASAGTLLLVRVDGNIVEQASLASFYSAQNNTQSFLFETSPVSFVTRIKNEGNIHIKPVGTIELKDIFGNIVTTMPINAEKSNVLPDSIRRFETQYSGGWMFGPYTANLALGYGTTGQAITRTITFWVIPYKLIIAIVLALATLIYILKRLVKVYNRHIIAKLTQTHDEKPSKSKKK